MEQGRLATTPDTTNPAIPHTAHSLYRQWRSRDFAEVIGQPHITQTLRNAVRTHSVGHAYLFTGLRGTGKTSTARILARAVNCLNPCEGEPCNECAPCRSILEGRCLDILEIDAASHTKVEEMRDLIDKIPYLPTEVQRKVCIVDEVHMLSPSSFNALLKTLEEPPAHMLFVLATTDMHKVPATVTSRCQRLDFRAIDLDDIASRLAYVCEQEGIQADRAALDLIAEQATGSLRDALSLLEQVRAYEVATISVTEVEEALGMARRETLSGLTEDIIAGDAGAALSVINELVAAGVDVRQYAKQLIGYWRDLLLLCAIGPAAARARSHDPRAMDLAARLSTSDVTAILKTILQPDYSGRRSASAQWQLELAVVEACQHFAAGREETGAQSQVQVRQTPPGAIPTNAAESILPRSSKTPAPMTAASTIAAPTMPPASRPTTAASSGAGQEPMPATSLPRAFATTVAPPTVIADPTDAGIMEAAALTAVKEPDGAYAVSETPTPPVPTTPPSGSAADEVVGVAQREPEAPRASQRQPQQQAVETPVVTPEPVAAHVEPPYQALATQDVREIWRQLLGALSRMPKQSLESTSKPVRFEGTTMVLAWLPGSNSFTRGIVEKATTRTQIEDALAKIVGQPVQVRYDTVDRQAMTTGNGPIANANGHGSNGTGGNANANGKAPPAVRRDAAPRDTFVDDAERTLRGLHMAPKRS